jgi:hypothetical protein
MQITHNILQILSAVTIGILVGALLTEGCLLVPYWRSLSADRFYGLYKELHPRLYRYFTPATVAPLLCSLLVGVSGFLLSDKGRWLLAGAFLLCLCAAVSHDVYFKWSNSQFVSALLTSDDLAVELRRWAIWHWGRTLLVGLAFGATLFSLMY